MSGTRRAAVVATGDELVTGATVDLNSSAIARALLERGWLVERFVVLGDDEAGLAAQLVELGARVALVVVTGGLGPTLDDLTREAVARAAGVALATDEGALAELRAWFARAGRTMAASNERQAVFPVGAEILPNAVGTAPGFALAIGGARVFVLPGPPREMSVMLEHELLPRLAELFPPQGALARHAFHLIGLAESVFADRAGSWMGRGENPLMGVGAKLGVLRVTLLARGASEREARAVLAPRVAAFRERFGEHVYSEDEPDLALVVGRELIRRELRTATAESCTGGLLAAALTRVPGISAVFEQGFVTYADAAKARSLGVDPGLIRAHGAVSAEVAGAMALGAAGAAGARLAVSITGIAGPSGGTAEKPVGLVHFGVALDGAVETAERRFGPRDREAIRELAVHTALDLVRRRLLAPGA